MNFIAKTKEEEQTDALDGECVKYQDGVPFDSTNEEAEKSCGNVNEVKIEEVQLKSEHGNGLKNEMSLFPSKVHDGLFELGGKERLTRQKAKDGAQIYNKLVNNEICRSCKEDHENATNNVLHELHTTMSIPRIIINMHD